MSDPLVILLLVGASEAHDAATVAAVAAARQVLGSAAVVLVEERVQAPGDDETRLEATGAHAQAVAALRWEDAAHARMIVRLFLVDGARWFDRDIAFGAGDDPAERGRTVGFAIASMVPAHAELPAGRGAEPSASPPKSPDVGVESSRRPSPPSMVCHGALGFALTGAIGGNPSGGAFAGGRWYVLPWLALRAGVGARIGRLDAAQADTLLTYGAIGPVVRFASTGGSQPIELSLRGDLLGLRQEVIRSSTVGTESHVSLLFGSGAALEGAWFFGPSGAIIAAVGAEAAFGTTRVEIGDSLAVDIPPLRGVGELGLLIRF
jgi:hypothetical protein